MFPSVTGMCRAFQCPSVSKGLKEQYSRGTEARLKAAPFHLAEQCHEMLKSHVSILSVSHEILKTGIMIVSETYTKGRLWY